MMRRTYVTRLAGGLDTDALLAAYAGLYGRAERTLFARLCAGQSRTALKREFLIHFGLTARQFNALAATVQGKITSIQKHRPVMINALERRIARARIVLRKVSRGTNKHHQKQRRLDILVQRLRVLRADYASGRVRLCFGSRKLFRQQFRLAATGYSSHEEWQRAWRTARSDQIFVLGSKDETAGCQGCVATACQDGTITLRLRLPDALSAYGKHLVIRGLRFNYGHETIVGAIGRNLSLIHSEREAISWRFVRARTGWRVFATVGVPSGKPRSIGHVGVVGVDVNTDHLAVTDIDRFGNPVASFRVPCATRGKSKHQALAVIGNAVSRVVAYASIRSKPVVIERLDFEAKKAELEHRGVGYARMLSGFPYAACHLLLQARAYDAGITLYRVNPVYTSLIGAWKFAGRYGLSRHQAAALSIGRRGMWLGERPNRRMGDHVALPLPARNRGKHVWSFWRQVGRRAAAHAARGRPGSLARSLPVPIPGSPGHGPARDQFVRCRWDSGTRIVSSAVRLTSVDPSQMSAESGTVPSCPHNPNGTAVRPTLVSV